MPALISFPNESSGARGGAERRPAGRERSRASVRVGLVDLALSFTVFSSIMDSGLRAAVARDILRVLGPGGGLLWYDFWTARRTRALEALGLDEVHRLFGRDPVDKRRVTLAPPIARVLAPRSLLACELLERSHSSARTGSPSCETEVGAFATLPARRDAGLTCVVGGHPYDET